MATKTEEQKQRRREAVARHRAKKGYNPEEERAQKLRQLYGITPEEYSAQLVAQDGVCAICGTDEPGGRFGTWMVVHCHETNKVRGLLCHRCNFGLGYFKDNQAFLESAIAYLDTEGVWE